MAKRFLDTGFLDQKWIRKLSPERKIFLIYLMLKCDNGGIIDLDFEDVEFWIGRKINSLDFLPKDYLILIDDSSKYFMPKFIEWQYPNFPHSKVHQQEQAKQILIKNGIFNIDTQMIELPKNCLKVTQILPKSQAIVNVNDNDNGIVNVTVIEPENRKIEFEVFWNNYDKKFGSKEDCRKKWNNLKLSEQQKIIEVLPVFIKSIKDKQYQPYPSTFLNQRRWENEIKMNEKPVLELVNLHP